MDERLGDLEYQSLLPTVTYAHCPICGYVLKCRADIYNVFSRWEVGPRFSQVLYPYGYRVLSIRDGINYTIPADYPMEINESDMFNGTQEFAHCEHFFGIHKFLNLHNSPLPFAHYTNYGEVPYVNRWLFESHTSGYAVLFAIPICKVENDSFVPAYTIFSLTYFTSDRKALIEEWRDNQKRAMAEDPEYYPGLIEVTYLLSHRDQSHDLAFYATLGKLGYLDFSKLHLPLRIEKGIVLPKIYRYIEGRSYYEWSNGRYLKYHRGEMLE